MVYFAVLTLSRNAILGLIISFLIILDKKKFIYLSIFLFTSFLIFSYVIPVILDIEFAKIINFSPFERYSEVLSLKLNSDHPRLIIWKNTIDLISQRPFLGWGAGTFPFTSVYFVEPTLKSYQHTHNLLFELAYSFGIPLTFLIGLTTTRMLFLGFKKIINSSKFFSNDFLYKPFLAAILIFLVTHMSDVTYFDGKISILFSVFMAALKNIIEKKDDLYYKNTLP
jgi:O-antigen ligase